MYFIKKKILERWKLTFGDVTVNLCSLIESQTDTDQDLNQDVKPG